MWRGSLADHWLVKYHKSSQFLDEEDFSKLVFYYYSTHLLLLSSVNNEALMINTGSTTSMSNYRHPNVRVCINNKCIFVVKGATIFLKKAPQKWTMAKCLEIVGVTFFRLAWYDVMRPWDASISESTCCNPCPPPSILTNKTHKMKLIQKPSDIQKQERR